MILNDIDGVIFDLDGTLLDSSWVWDLVDEKFLGDRGFAVPDDYVDAISPLGAMRAAKYTIERFGLEEKAEDIVAEWINMAKKQYEDEVICKPHALDYIRYLQKIEMPMSVATSSDPELFNATLKREGIFSCFKHIITTDDVSRGKGYPDIYEKAAECMRVSPTRCLVFEDIYAGVSGAKLGNFVVVAVADEKSNHNRERIKRLADYFIDDFNELIPKTEKVNSQIERQKD